jgi:hypothetical protein
VVVVTDGLQFLDKPILGEGSAAVAHLVQDAAERPNIGSASQLHDGALRASSLETDSKKINDDEKLQQTIGPKQKQGGQNKAHRMPQNL